MMLALFCASIATSLWVGVDRWDFQGEFSGIHLHADLWLRLVPYYLAGVIFYLFRDRLRLDWRGAIVAMIGLGVGAVVPFGMAVALPTLGTYVLLCLAFSPHMKLHDVARFGDFSYGIYLYAFPIQQLLVLWISHDVNPYLLFSLALPPTVVAGMLSWYVVERRFLQRVKRRPRQPPRLILGGLGVPHKEPPTGPRVE